MIAKKKTTPKTVKSAAKSATKTASKPSAAKQAGRTATKAAAKPAKKPAKKPAMQLNVIKPSVNNLSVRIFARAESPDGSMWVEFFPIELFYWLQPVTSPVPVGGRSLGMIHAPGIGAQRAHPVGEMRVVLAKALEERAERGGREQLSRHQRLDHDRIEVEREAELARQDEGFARHVGAREIVLRLGLGIAELDRARDGL